MNRFSGSVILALSIALVGPAQSQGSWHLVLDGSRFGTVDLLLDGAISADRVELTQRSGSIRITNTSAEGQGWVSHLTRAADRGSFSGRFEDGPLRGRFQTEAFEGSALRNYPALAATALALTRRHLFDPRLAEDDGWRRYERALAAAAARAADDWDFLTASEEAQRTIPFSHYRLFRPNVTFEQMVTSLDSRPSDRPAASFQLRGSVGIVRVDSVQGRAASEQINSAFQALFASNARSLIVDLRANSGGSFAVIDVAAPILDAAVEGGVFVAAPWWRSHDSLPSARQVAAMTPFASRNLMDWFDALDRHGVARTRFMPGPRHFDARIHVLTSRETASAAEMLVDVLKRSGRVTVIGERTAGQMLSSQMYSMDDGFGVFVPVADYVTAEGTRIEGGGVPPDVEASAGDALDVSLQRLAVGSR